MALNSKICVVILLITALSACSYDETIYSFTNMRYAFLDKTGKLKYWPNGTEALTGFHDGYAIYKGLDFDESKSAIKSSGFIGLDGILHPQPFSFDEYSKLSEGLALVFDPKTKKYCYIDSSGKKRIETDLNLHYPVPCHPFSEGLAAVFVARPLTGEPPMQSPANGMSECWDGRWGYINKTGKFVIPPKFTSISDFSSGRARVTFADAPQNIVVIDRKGKIIFKNEHDELSSFSKDGFAVFKNKSKEHSHGSAHCGLLDRNGKLCIKNTDLHNFNDGIGLQSSDAENTYVFVDAKGRKSLEIPRERRVWCWRSEYPRFSDGFAAMVVKKCVLNGGKKRELYAKSVYEYIDKSGKPLKTNSDQVITKAIPFDDGQAVVELATMTSKDTTINPLIDPTGLK